MAQQQSPWVEGLYGWDFGESGWNFGMDQNLLKFSFMFDRNVDSVTATLPPAVNGQAHYLITDNRLYFAVGSSYFSTPVPKWFEFKDRSTGNTYQYNGTAVVQIDSPAQIDARLDAVELTVNAIGTAAFHDTEFFATQSALEVATATASNYTDTLREDLADPSKGASLLGRGVIAVSTMADLMSLPVQQRLVGVRYLVDGISFRWLESNTWVNDSGYITAEAFGAVFDGLVSDTLPLQAAIEYAQDNNIPLVSHNKTARLGEAVVVQNITWISYGTELVTSEVGKPTVVAYNAAPQLIGQFRFRGAYDGTQGFPVSVTVAEHEPGTHAYTTLDFIYTDIPTSSSDTGLLFRFTAKQRGIRVGEVHSSNHGTGVYWLSNSATPDNYTEDTVIEAIYHENVWSGIVMVGARDFRCKTVKGSYIRRLAPLDNDPAHCIYLGDQRNPYRSEGITFDHVENVVTPNSPVDSVISVKGANRVLVKNLIAHDAVAGGTINAECRVLNLHAIATTKVVPSVWLVDSNQETWTREEAGTSICEIESAKITNSTGRGSDELGSQQTALFGCYGGSRARGTYSAIRVRNLDAALSGTKPMYVAMQESDEIQISGKVFYQTYLTDPALYNYGNNDGSFNSWAALYPVALLWPGTPVTQKVSLLIEGYRWAIGTVGTTVDATFSCIPKDKTPTEVVALGDIRKEGNAYFTANASGVTSDVGWTAYPFSFSHEYSYRSGFKTAVYGIRQTLIQEPPVQRESSDTTFRPYGQPYISLVHTASVKDIIDVQGIPVGQSVRILNRDFNIQLVHLYNANALRCSTGANYTLWSLADLINMGNSYRIVAAY